VEVSAGDGDGDGAAFFLRFCAETINALNNTMLLMMINQRIFMCFLLRLSP